MKRLRERTASFLFIAGSLHIIFIFGLFFIGSITLLMNMPLSRFGLLSLIGVLYWVWFTSKKYFPDKYLSMFIILITSFIALLLLSLYFSGKIYDLSPDGQTYHQEAIDRLANGWNPIWSYEKNDIDARLTYYPKAPWIYEASIYKVTKYIEYAKVFNFPIMFSAFCLIMGIMLKATNIKSGLIFIISLLASLNPVNILQVPSNYVDGHLFSMLTIVCCLAFYCIYEKKDIIPLLILLACSLTLVINVKTTGMVYAGLLITGILPLFYILGGLGRARLALISGTAAFAFIIGIAILGYNPYINNLLMHQNPFYPIGAQYWPGTTSSPVDLIEIGMPETWKSYNRLEKIFATIFSESAVAWDSPWKLPFTFKMDELMRFIEVDVRVAGFGPLFGGAMVLSVISLIIVLIFNWTSAAFLSISVILLLIISIIINPVAWYSRYAPQLWLVPVICAGLCFYFRPREILSRIGLVVIFVLILDIALISTVRITAVLKDNELFKTQLSYLIDLNKPVKVYFSNFYANRIRFNDMGISATEIGRDELVTCRKTLPLVRTETVVCLD
ncbi:MAG: hypothetical protein IT393_09105 [Nitrospirae bacterium]|nr:hypothetical protein [Nitrospirota bacterium]